MNSAEKQKAVKYVTAIDEAELTCRLLEAAGNLTRPEGLSAVQALGIIDEVDRQQWRRVAHAAMDYWRECINHLNKTN